ncbi:PEP-CTERM sorting domain-containing protein [Piscinibacter sakaiensis]|uniref:PEP-CTERM sorting domain-containing protein n=1 Tax=Piscinibacter sakaiensis TaxID=1547922 RepID=UPI003AADFFCB
MRSKFAIAGLLLTACTWVAAAALPGLGTNGTQTWEQLRFYGPSGGKNSLYADGQPTSIGSVIGGTDLCADADICGQTLRFNTLLGGAVTATGSTTAGGTTAIVRQDLYPKYGGLGVQGYKAGTSSTSWVWKSSKTKYQKPEYLGNTKYGSYKTVTTPPTFYGNDEINAGDTLTLSFEKTVRVLGFHFFDGNHGISRLAGDSFGLSINGAPKVDYKFSLLGGYPFDTSLLLIGNSFTFSLANTRPESFYLGAIKIAEFIATPVPEPTTLGMMLAGLTGLAVFLRKRPSRLAAKRQRTSDTDRIQPQHSPISAYASG